MSDSLPRNDELLSAYIDGELTEVERAQVAAWLADDPRAQSLLEELQGVSTAVKSLPTTKLQTDLTAAILSKVADNGAPHDSEATHDATLSLPERDSQRRFSGRGLWWSAAAIAAAIAIALFVPQQAQVDQGPIAAQQAPRGGGAGEMSARGVDPAPTDDVVVMSKEPADVAGGGLGGGFRGGDLPGPPPTSSEAAPLVARGLPTPPPPGEDPASLAMDGNRGGDAMGVSGEPVADNELADVASPTQYLVVYVDVSAQAIERRAIDQVFAGNNIAVDSESDDWQAAAEPVRLHVASRSADLAYVAPESGTPQNTTADTPFAAASQIAEEGEAILVEATWEQVSQTLKQLQADGQNFDNVRVETIAQPAPVEDRQLAEGESPQGTLADAVPAAPEGAAPEGAAPEPASPNSAPSEPRQRSADPQPTAEPPAPPAPSFGPAIRSGPPTREVPPDEPPAETDPEGRYSLRQDRREEQAPPEAAETRVLGRARRLQVVTREKESTPSTAEGQTRPYDYSATDRAEREAAGSELQRSQLRPPSARPLGTESGQQPGEAKATSRPASVQVLFVLRARPPEIAAEAAPAPAPAPPAAPE
jgi:hypothetical protein